MAQLIEHIRLEIEVLPVREALLLESLCCVLEQDIQLLSTGSTQEDRKLLLHGCKIND